MPVHTRYHKDETNVVRHVVYRHGIKETVFSYRMDESLKYISQLRKGKRHGYTLLFKNGKKVKCIHYRNGVLHGKVSSYYDNGQSKCIMYYRNGQASGLVKEFSEEGELQQKCRYKDGKLHGEFISYSSSGSISIYQRSHDTCTVMEYSADGFLTKKIQRIASDIFTADHFSRDGHVTLNVIFKRNCSAKAIVYDDHHHILERCILDKNYQPERDTLFCNDVTAVQYCHDIVECHVCMEKTRFQTLCHHGLCLSCATKWIRENNNYFTCPTCRHDEYATFFV